MYAKPLVAKKSFENPSGNLLEAFEGVMLTLSRRPHVFFFLLYSYRVLSFGRAWGRFRTALPHASWHPKIFGVGEVRVVD
jgi:hypothetical protein